LPSPPSNLGYAGERGPLRGVGETQGDWHFFGQEGGPRKSSRKKIKNRSALLL